MENINWYPGHMKKTRELIKENLKLVDVVIEVIDARIPVSSRNPIIDQLIKDKPRIIVLNKSDLADENVSRQWREYFGSEGFPCHFYELCQRGGSQRTVSNTGEDVGGEEQGARCAAPFPADDSRRSQCRKVVADKQDDREEERPDGRQAGGHQRKAVAEAEE